jgi:hypothetical protein
VVEGFGQILISFSVARGDNKTKGARLALADRVLALMEAATNRATKCGCCSAAVLEDFDDCRAMFNAVLEREYSMPTFGEAHLFTVDAFCLQHSEQCGPRSNAFHLMRLCWLVEHAGNPSIRQVQSRSRALYDAYEKRCRQLPFLRPPTLRGELTVVHVLQAKSPKEHVEHSKVWGQCVWETWREHHVWAREQVTEWFSPKGK